MKVDHSTFQFKIFAIIVAISAAFVGCQKSERDLDTETLAARDNAIAYHIFDDAFREVHRFAMRDSLLNDTGIKIWYDKCIKKATLSDTVAVFPLYLTLNFGNDTARCNDGFQRFGFIRATFTGKYLNKDTEIAISFDNYRKDDFYVSGEMLVKNLGLNGDGRRQYSVKVTDGLITSNNIRIDWQADHLMTWVAGSSTDGIIDDDIFEVTGSASGRNSRGNTFTNGIYIAYTDDLSCQWFKSGESELNVPNLQTRYIKYGNDGTCDNRFTQWRDNSTFEVTIPY